MDSKTIRSRFLDYFAKHGHRVVPSSPIVPESDPTLYFTNAGMVQFKDVFIGEERRDYSRACSSQKCLRVSGKHNDLENVGRTSRHHTFFEMLGNFSFGDYFKREAIELAWKFLVEEMELPAERLVATIFAGEGAVPADEDSFAVWRNVIGLPEERIQRYGSADNFWSMGDTGPCGPCSELHYFQGADIPCNEPTCAGVACECDRWVEVWNLVFMQYNRQPGGALQPLAATGVDTGMGLERLVAVKQGVLSTFETDLLRPLIDHVGELAGKRYGASPEDDISMRVVADHARASAICIADGVFPEKGGREYVLRRIVRRAIRHGKRLGLEEPFFHLVCGKVVDELGDAYPELHERREVITTIVQAEETSFRRTLNRGLQKLHSAIESALSRAQDELPPAFVGDLYATDGFPIDLTRTIAEEAGLKVDEQRAHAWVTETHGATDTKVGGEAVLPVYKAIFDSHGPTAFVGYDEGETSSRVLALVVDGALVERAEVGQEADVITAATPFYGRAGGQVGDTGVIRWAAGQLEVRDTSKPGGNLIVHHGQVTRGVLAAGQEVALEVTQERRRSIRRNHSATHLLHHALRQVLGEHVAQKGSEVAPNHLRFDFSHFEAMTAEQIRRVEREVNEEIRRDLPARTDRTSFNEARMLGAMALFGEKYGEEVRVVRIGDVSMELCGGTHVARSGEIGLFKIVSEEALALGVRRVVALTGAGAVQWVQEQERRLLAAAAALRSSPEEVPERIEKLQAQLREREREIEGLRRRLATGGGTDLLAQVREVSGIKVLATRVEAADPKTLRQAGDTLRDRLGSGVVVLGGEHNGKATILVMVSEDLTNRYHAGKIVGQLAKVVDGKGGGRPDMAQAGGPRLELLDKALERVFEIV